MLYVFSSDFRHSAVFFSFKDTSLSLIIHFLEVSLVKENKGGSGREDRGRDDRWRDCVKGGFCLINCFSGAGECQVFGRAPGPAFCGIVKFMTRASELISPPLVSSSASFSLLLKLTLTSLAAAFSDLSPEFFFFQSAAEQFCTPRTSFWQIQQLPSHTRPTPWVFKPFYGTHCKSISWGNDGGDRKQPARYTWAKLHCDYPLITNIINLEKTSVVCEWFITNGNFILCAHQGLCWGRVWGLNTDNWDWKWTKSYQ